MPPTSSSQAAIKEPFQPVAALLGVAFPGLGHFYLGQIKRGVLIAVGVLGLYLTGLLIGGISCIDRQDNFVWFLGQSLVGPITLGLDYIHQKHLKVLGKDAPSGMPNLVLREPYPDETRDSETGLAVTIEKDAQGKPLLDASGHPYAKVVGGRIISPAYPPYVKSLSRTSELGTLFTTIAGFLNVIVVIDAAFNVPYDRRRSQPGGRGRAASSGSGSTPGSTSPDGVKRTLRVPGPGGGGA